MRRRFNFLALLLVLIRLNSAEEALPSVELPSKPAWAMGIGKDQYGIWADLWVAGVVQRFRLIQPGTFTMGSPQAEKDTAVASETRSAVEAGWFKSEVPHPVTLAQCFWLADSECTQAFWQEIAGSNPSLMQDSIQNPVEMVSWDDCQQFIAKLNARVPGGNFLFPSEAQWEYACRAGTSTAFSFGSTISPEQVDYDGDYPFGNAEKGLTRNITVPVRSLPPNAWGLYEMHGNVWEWCNDWNGAYSGSAVRDPTGPLSGDDRVARGGGWFSHASFCRSAQRYMCPPKLRMTAIGFRLAAPAIP